MNNAERRNDYFPSAGVRTGRGRDPWSCWGLVLYEIGITGAASSQGSLKRDSGVMEIRLAMRSEVSESGMQ